MSCVNTRPVVTHVGRLAVYLIGYTYAPGNPMTTFLSV
jgi:hypothetical protein